MATRRYFTFPLPGIVRISLKQPSNFFPGAWQIKGSAG